MSNQEDDERQQQEAWSTWEELLLAFAVKRHGCHNWDSVAMELQTRCSLPRLLTSPDSCRLKFHDLRRRFAGVEISGAENDVEGVGIAWVEELRSLRVAELRAEVNRHDVSISSLQLKVKKLQDGDEDPTRLQSRMQDEEEMDEKAKPDLGNRSGDDDDDKPTGYDPGNRSGDDEEDGKPTGSDDPGNQSANGSNSTGPNKDRGSGQKETGPSVTQQNGGLEKAEPDLTRSNPKPPLTENEPNEASSGSDVQSSAATLSRRMRVKEEVSGSVRMPQRTSSEPLLNVLALVRAHKDASLFERPLLSQETKQYNNLVRQHMDLQTIQNRLESDSYASPHLNFFRDLLLVYTNAMIFFPKSSLEYRTAQELRGVVSSGMDEHLKESRRRSEEKLTSAPPSPGAAKPSLERSDSLLAKHKSAGGPIIVCRKRSAISAKGVPAARKTEQLSDHGEDTKTVALADLKPAPSPKDEQPLLNSKTKDKIVTGTRSLRRSNTSLKNPLVVPSSAAPTTATTTNSDKKEAATTSQAAAPTEKKKEEASANKRDDTSSKKKGAADFLKRLKGNSPVKSKDPKNEAKSSGTKGNKSLTTSEQPKRTGNGEKVDGRRKIATRRTDAGKQTKADPTKRNVGRPSKKAAEPSTTATKRSREAEASKQPKKRARK